MRTKGLDEREGTERVPAVPAVVLQHVEGSVGEEGGAGHGLIARVPLGEPQLFQHHLTVAEQLIQTQLPAVTGIDTFNLPMHNEENAAQVKAMAGVRSCVHKLT